MYSSSASASASASSAAHQQHRQADEEWVVKSTTAARSIIPMSPTTLTHMAFVYFELAFIIFLSLQSFGETFSLFFTATFHCDCGLPSLEFVYVILPIFSPLVVLVLRLLMLGGLRDYFRTQSSSSSSSSSSRTTASDNDRPSLETVKLIVWLKLLLFFKYVSAVIAAIMRIIIVYKSDIDERLYYASLTNFFLCIYVTCSLLTWQHQSSLYHAFDLQHFFYHQHYGTRAGLSVLLILMYQVFGSSLDVSMALEYSVSDNATGGGYAARILTWLMMTPWILWLSITALRIGRTGLHGHNDLECDADILATIHHHTNTNSTDATTASASSSSSSEGGRKEQLKSALWVWCHITGYTATLLLLYLTVVLSTVIMRWSMVGTTYSPAGTYTNCMIFTTLWLSLYLIATLLPAPSSSSVVGMTMLRNITAATPSTTATTTTSPGVGVGVSVGLEDVIRDDDDVYDLAQRQQQQQEQRHQRQQQQQQQSHRHGNVVDDFLQGHTACSSSIRRVWRRLRHQLSHPIWMCCVYFLFTACLTSLVAIQRQQTNRSDKQWDEDARYRVFMYFTLMLTPATLLSNLHCIHTGLTNQIRQLVHHHQSRSGQSELLFDSPTALMVNVAPYITPMRPLLVCMWMLIIIALVILSMLTYFLIYVYDFAPASDVWRDRSPVFLSLLSLIAFTPIIGRAILSLSSSASSASSSSSSSSATSASSASSSATSSSSSVRMDTISHVRRAPATSTLRHRPLMNTSHHTYISGQWMATRIMNMLLQVFVVIMWLIIVLAAFSSRPRSSSTTVTTTATTSSTVSYPPPVAPGSFRVVTYNAHLGLDRRGRANMRDMVKELLPVDADFVGLQEAETTSMLFSGKDLPHWFAKHLKREHIYYGARYAPGRWSPKVLSRHQPSGAETQWIGSDIHSESDGAQNAFVHLWYEMPYTPSTTSTTTTVTLHIIVVHCNTDDDISYEEIENIMLYTSEYRHCIIMGDFNFHEQTERGQYQLLQTRGSYPFNEVWPTIYPSGTKPITIPAVLRERPRGFSILPTDSQGVYHYSGWTNQEGLDRIDMIWYTSDTLLPIHIDVISSLSCIYAQCTPDTEEYVECKECSASDHLGVWADLKIIAP